MVVVGELAEPLGIFHFSKKLSVGAPPLSDVDILVQQWTDGHTWYKDRRQNDRRVEMASKSLPFHHICSTGNRLGSDALVHPQGHSRTKTTWECVMCVKNRGKLWQPSGSPSPNMLLAICKLAIVSNMLPWHLIEKVCKYSWKKDASKNWFGNLITWKYTGYMRFCLSQVKDNNSSKFLN